MKYYSKTTRGFYDTELHGTSIPTDAVEISLEYYAELWAGQENGKHIVPSDTGLPVLADPAPVVLTYAESRTTEYPSVGDQLDALFHAGVFPPEMAAQLQAVKDKYPKGPA